MKEQLASTIFPDMCCASFFEALGERGSSRGSDVRPSEGPSAAQGGTRSPIFCASPFEATLRADSWPGVAKDARHERAMRRERASVASSEQDRRARPGGRRGRAAKGPARDRVGTTQGFNGAGGSGDGERTNADDTDRSDGPDRTGRIIIGPHPVIMGTGDRRRAPSPADIPRAEAGAWATAHGVKAFVAAAGPQTVRAWSCALSGK